MGFTHSDRKYSPIGVFVSAKTWSYQYTPQEGPLLAIFIEMKWHLKVQGCLLMHFMYSTTLLATQVTSLNDG